ncbi:DNA polymerase III PolC-type [Candidatus Bilamarchaeum dharawalense]|uniref:DNA polymerase III PolC-type n=1 Tax=Candidatus Bilamarchaeum dharawalense TaxID=2885759 RepID=A0A5E4LUS5_9ARCH|nr:DNA polymerase III PolC-type [Candidatus Bilamarchaeum dharawalense]
MIDLHTHTNASDGSLTLEQLVEHAKSVGLKAIAITDHDCVLSAAKIPKTKSKFEVIPGVELSIYDHQLGYLDIHLIGLYINPKNPGLVKRLDQLQKEREAQKKATVAKLNELGYKITFDEVKKKADGSVGRPHIAKVLLEKYPNDFSSISDVFSKLLGRGKKAYLDRDIGFSLKEAIELVHGAGGLAFLAHPFLYPYDSKKLVSDFKKLGGDGLETFYDYITNRSEVKLTEKENIAMIVQAEHLAMDFDLLECGGSDFHGQSKGQQLGIFCAPDEVLGLIKEAISYSR